MTEKQTLTELKFRYKNSSMLSEKTVVVQPYVVVAASLSSKTVANAGRQGGLTGGDCRLKCRAVGSKTPKRMAVVAKSKPSGPENPISAGAGKDST